MCATSALQEHLLGSVAWSPRLHGLRVGLAAASLLSSLGLPSLPLPELAERLCAAVDAVTIALAVAAAAERLSRALALRYQLRLPLDCAHHARRVDATLFCGRLFWVMGSASFVTTAWWVAAADLALRIATLRAAAAVCPWIAQAADGEADVELDEI